MCIEESFLDRKTVFLKKVIQAYMDFVFNFFSTGTENSAFLDSPATIFKFMTYRMKKTLIFIFMIGLSISF